jgi:hypothetical protein
MYLFLVVLLVFDLAYHVDQTRLINMYQVKCDILLIIALAVGIPLSTLQFQ